MARRKKGNKIDGWIIIDKPEGLGSTDVVRRLKYLLKPLKIGHGGTLDPLATGILPIGLGEATKTMPFVTDARKVYQFKLVWGEERSTDDLEGEVTVTSDVRPTEQQISDILPSFLGTIEQVPPAYSAIKIDGKRAYDLVRAGEEVEMKPRCVEIHDLTYLGDNDQGESLFEVMCGKGTYIRSLGRDIARKLGSAGHIRDLRRTKVGPFDLNSAISLEKSEQLSNSAPAHEWVLPVMTALDDIPALALTEAEATKVRHGNAVNRSNDLSQPDQKYGFIRLLFEQQLLAIAKCEDDLIKPVRVFNL